MKYCNLMEFLYISVNCNEKAVKEAYHILCSKCATDKKVCAKCQESAEIVSRSVR